MQMIGENVTEAQLSEMLALADLDKDGRINYEGMRLQPESLIFYFPIFLSRVCKIAIVNSQNQSQRKTLDLRIQKNI